MKSVVILFATLVIIPFLCGLLPSFFIDKRKTRPGIIYVAGFLCYMALFQLVALPVIIFKGDGFPIIVISFSVLSILFAISGVILYIKKSKIFGSPGMKITRRDYIITKEEKIEWLIFFVLLGIQVFAAVYFESFDGDDAYYVTQSLLTDETNTLYRILPYTGLTTNMDLRHAMSSIPIWIAYLGRISGIHTTIIAHTVVPVVMILLCYILYYECGNILLKKDRKILPVFMIFVSLLNIFGNVSIYTVPTFFLTRTWQGKSILCNFVLMLVLWLFLSIYESERFIREWRMGYWIMLFLLCIVTTMCTTAGIFLVSIMIGVCGIVLFLATGNMQNLLRLFLVSIPLMACGALYILW